jgi:uncharacterized membrane protein
MSVLQNFCLLFLQGRRVIMIVVIVVVVVLLYNTFCLFVFLMTNFCSFLSALYNKLFFFLLSQVCHIFLLLSIIRVMNRRRSNNKMPHKHMHSTLYNDVLKLLVAKSTCSYR